MFIYRRLCTTLDSNFQTFILVQREKDFFKKKWSFFFNWNRIIYLHSYKSCKLPLLETPVLSYPTLEFIASFSGISIVRCAYTRTHIWRWGEREIISKEYNYPVPQYPVTAHLQEPKLPLYFHSLRTPPLDLDPGPSSPFMPVSPDLIFLLLQPVRAPPHILPPFPRDSISWCRTSLALHPFSLFF